MCVGVKQMGEISEEEQELLIAIGNQIAVAVENAHLYAEVQHKEQVRGELFKKAINVQEEERKRIARELHDETSQALTALIYATEESLDMEDLGRAKQRMQSMLELTQRILDGVHKIIFDLRPSMLDHLGLVPAIRWLAQSRLDPQVAHVTIEESSPPLRLSPEIETALFRVIQEAVANVARHAAARNVCISFNVADDNAFISIKDDGIGFDINALAIEPDTGRGLGLLGMEERVELLGGELEIQTAPGQGTQILIQVPLDGRRVTVG